MTDIQLAALCAALVLHGTLRHSSPDGALFLAFIAAIVLFGIAGAALGHRIAP